jgi:hypothetical protein
MGELWVIRRFGECPFVSLEGVSTDEEVSVVVGFGCHRIPGMGRSDHHRSVVCIGG